MKYTLLRKGLVCGIFIIFIGLSFTPSISGNNKKINNQIPLEYPSNFYPDFTNAYWKFDECEGDIAYDSSGNDYDGIVNGAKWITYGAGCALEFDGIDDFVDLDVHSKGVGLNKTDDAIFTGYFNSSTTEDGLIYSMSDGGDKENPEFSIQLCGNGSVMLQIWVNQCGIKLFSEDTDYNDGDWHSFKIIYDGTTSQPTVDLFVDNSFEGTITKWLCAMFADEYKRAKIGRRAVAEERHFEGAIDRLKMIKYPGGNERPSPPVIDGDAFGMPGEEMCFTFNSTDYEGDELWYLIDWGDGEDTGWIGSYDAGEEITRCHVYDEIGTYNIKAKAKDVWRESYWTDPPFPVSIGNHAPFKPEIPTGPLRGSVNIEYTFSTSTTDEENNDIWYNWSWGDGTYSGWMGPYKSGETCYASHTWTEPDIYEVKVKAKDDTGESPWSETWIIEIVISALKIDEITGGLLFVNSVIRNSGSWEATDVSWDIELEGGLILLGRNTTGEIPSIPIGEREDIRSGLVLGLGPVIAKVTARSPDGSHDEYDRNAFIFFIYVKINPGGG